MEELSQMADRLQKQINDYNKYTSYPISYAVGYDVSYKNHYFLINDLIQEVDKKMYQDKQYRKSRTGSLAISSTNVIINQMNAIMKAGTPETKYVLTMTDIAKFNLINAIYGYSMGNEILNAVSMEIDRFPNTIETFRVYSDVFISIVAIGAQFEKDILKRIADCNRKVADVVASQFSVDYFVLNTGIYKIGTNAVDEKTVFNVSAALQEAKKNTEHICTYSQKIGQKKLFQAEILNSFWNAMNNDEFELYIQPKISAQTEQIHSAEALVRWCRNGKILYFPDQFIPLLEKSGDIIELDFHMCEKVFQWLHQRETIQEKVMPISVNISTEHFYKPDRLIEKINELQQQYPIQPEHLIFEITETAYISHLDAVNDIIDRLHQQGFRVSMDDFGSGYSSLNTLQDVRFDEIKIDKQFLANGLTFNGKIVLQEIFHMLKRMHKTIVCEGVETKEAIDFLMEINCDEMQGYYYYKPMPIQEFEQIIL